MQGEQTNRRNHPLVNAIAEVEVRDAPANVRVPADRRAYRLAPLDALRGIVIVVMAQLTAACASTGAAVPTPNG